MVHIQLTSNLANLETPSQPLPKPLHVHDDLWGVPSWIRPKKVYRMGDWQKVWYHFDIVHLCWICRTDAKNDVCVRGRVCVCVCVCVWFELKSYIQRIRPRYTKKHRVPCQKVQWLSIVWQTKCKFFVCTNKKTVFSPLLCDYVPWQWRTKNNVWQFPIHYFEFWRQT